MEYLRLGGSALSVSRVGFGCAAMGGYDYGTVDDGESRVAVRRALELGINFFDTADVYGFGHAEEVLAHALGEDRHAVVIATKFGVAWDSRGRTRRDTSARWLERALTASLERLRVDHIPLYQVHWPDGVTPWSETLWALEQAKQAGKIGTIGLCNVSAAELDEAERQTRIDTLQLPFGLLHRSAEGDLRQSRQRHAVGLLTYNSLGQGLLAGKYGTASTFSGSDLRARGDGFSGAALAAKLAVAECVRAVGEQYQKSSAQVALRWALQALPGSVVLSGIKRSSQIEDNAGAVGWSLSAGDLAALSGVANSHGTGNEKP